MANYKTPGVYVEEISKFPPSVAQVETAIPAFIGYTEKAEKLNGDTLSRIPTRITSLLEYETYFGKAKNEDTIQVNINDVIDAEGDIVSRAIKVQQPTNKQPFLMYYSLQMYFANGGGPCYIVSVDQYGKETSPATLIKFADLENGLKDIEKEDEPTLLLFPDATNLGNTTNFYSIYTKALEQCNKLQDRFTIVDTEHSDESGTHPIDDLRDEISLGKDYLKYGAAYYPFLETILDYQYSEDDIEITHVSTVPRAVPFALTSIEESETAVDTRLSALYNTSVASAFAGTLADSLDYMYSLNTYDHGGGTPGFRYDTSGPDPTVADASVAKIKSFATDQLDPLIADLELLINLKKTIVSDTNSVIASVEDDDDSSDDPIRVALAALTPDFEDADKIESVYAALIDLSPAMKKVKSADAEGLALEAGAALSKLATHTFAAATYTNVTNIFSDIATNIDAIVAAVTTVSNNKTDTNNGIMNGRKLGDVEGIDNITYNKIKQEISFLPVTLPPSSAMAGIYARVDGTRGVWKAPANVGVTYVMKPAVSVSHEQQGDYNVHSTGKSVNAIRSFTGKGTLVWGARTLAGNDNEWRYVPVRRFFNMVEESVSKATEQFVFEGNDANTWVRVRAMIENFLILQWKAGALTGAKAEQAFYVRVGLGQTMTAQDILEGRMIIEIGMAVVRPAEFIILRFSHKMQEA